MLLQSLAHDAVADRVPAWRLDSFTPAHHCRRLGEGRTGGGNADEARPRIHSFDAFADKLCDLTTNEPLETGVVGQVFTSEDVDVGLDS
ncbi:hypothetical protein A3H10_04275 [Candidatus Uhrbacteria bacterium RIFCSPLOWO2_12_FULL_46_10]|nr:MAG: hypothetical protein A3H10_04275 [Candidatus Uhrbacteria bacterium RIFCSPLOWO2_12_FULL_46_10]